MSIYSVQLDLCCVFFFFFQAEDGIRDYKVTGVQTCALPISGNVGMLGRGYPGTYRLASEAALARQIRRAALDPAYYARLKRLTIARRPLFRPAAEREGLRKLLAELAPRPQRSPSRISRTGAKLRR